MVDNINPILEKVEPEFGSSFVMRTFSYPSKRPVWHYHPEIELVYIEEGSGKRHVGNHISHFSDGDLLLIGSNVPHYGFSPTLNDIEKEIVVQFNESCFGKGFLNMVETSSIRNVFDSAQLGISFHGETKKYIGQRLKRMLKKTSFEKLIELIKIFHVLSLSDQYTILNATGTSLQVKGDDNLRIDSVYEYVRNNFSEKISVDQIANEVNMTVSSFCRFFKKTTNKTFVQFLNEYRIAHACNLLGEQSHSVLDIAFECGFSNQSNFNRAFRKITGKSPSQFRQEKVRVVI